MILIILVSYPVYAQNTPTFLSEIVTRTDSRLSQFPTEKVYLHLNKSTYAYADTIRFKAYVVIGEKHQLSAYSSILYTELINLKDSVLQRIKLPIISGTASGNFILLKSYRPGIYRIRSYTKWMRNAGAAYFYDEPVVIGGDSFTQIKQNNSVQPVVQFFPEGGNLVNGIRRKIAFKAVNKDGQSMDVSGTVKDQNEKAIAVFKSQHAGMGVFAITPEPGKSYTAYIKVSDDNPAFSVKLPDAVDDGFTLAVFSRSKDSLDIKMGFGNKLISEKQNCNFYLTGETSGKIYYTSAGKIKDNALIASVDKKRFPTGIARFVLFDENGTPMNERSVFIENNDTLHFQVDMKPGYEPGEKIAAKMEVKNAMDIPVEGTFSVAVVTEADFTNNKTSTIKSNLLLTSDIISYVEKPDYYLNNTNSATMSDLDILMLTQNYRKYDGNKAAGSPGSVIKYPVEKSLSLSGTVKTSSGREVPNASVRMMIENDMVLDTVADKNGHFTFTDLNIADSTRVLLQVLKEKTGKNLVLKVDEEIWPAVTEYKTGYKSFSAIQQQSVATSKTYKQATKQYQEFMKQDSLKNVTLKEVQIRAKKKSLNPVPEYSSSLLGPDRADQVLLEENLTPGARLSDRLTGKILGVSFALDGAPLNLRKNRSKMAIIVDGNRLDGSEINNINANDVYSIEVLRSTYSVAIYGSDLVFGALVITMKRGRSSKVLSEAKPGWISYVFKGLYNEKPNKPEQGSSKNASFAAKNSMYWQPNLITDKNGKASFEFLNSKTPGKYYLIIEGIDGNGHLGRHVIKYTVK